MQELIMILIKLALFLGVIFVMEGISRKYKKSHKIKRDDGNSFLYESDSLLYWVKGAKKTKYYWGFWVPALLFFVLAWLVVQDDF